ncbi:MAG: hypothetical protein ACUVUQ_11445, partial [Thermodesulfovibrionales bacterium]
MSRIAHILRKNIKSETKDRWIFFDCETKVSHMNDKEETHVLKLGIAQYYNLSSGDTCLDEQIFHTPEEFAEFLFRHVYPKTTLNVVSLNLPFDFAVSGIAYLLKEQGYALSKFFYDSNITIIKYKKDKYSIVF